MIKAGGKAPTRKVGLHRTPSAEIDRTGNQEYGSLKPRRGWSEQGKRPRDQTLQSTIGNTLDFKLPFTALAGIIVAAVQATGTTTGFGAACTWSFVILIAAVEAAIGFSKQKVHWQQWQRTVTAIAAISVAVFVVGFLDWQAYRKEYLADDLRVNFQIPHPGQVGTNELDLNFLIATKAPVSMLLEETVAVEVASTDFSNNPGRNTALCKLLAPYIVGKSARETWLHPGSIIRWIDLHSLFPRLMKTFQESRHHIQTMANLIWHFTSRNPY